MADPSKVRPPDRVIEPCEVSAETRTEWELLAQRTGGGYFTGPAWTLAWLSAFAADGRSEIALWEGPKGLDAVAAMARTPVPLVPGPMARRLRVSRWQNAGAGLGGADHLGFPSGPELQGSVLEWVLSHRGSVELNSLAPHWERPLLTRPLNRREAVRTWATDLSESPRPGSKKLWKHLTRSRRQLVERGVEFDHLWGRELIGGPVAELIELHSARSAAAGRSSTFTHRRRPFHDDLAASSSDVHSSFMVRARSGGRMVGALYGFADSERVHYYQSGWDPEFERWSLGSVLIGEAIDLAVQRGASVFDFLRGDEPYKVRFGAAPASDVSVLVARGVSGSALVLRGRVLDARRRRAESSPSDGGSTRPGGPLAPST